MKRKKPIKPAPVKEKMSFGVLQPEKFKKIIIIGICFLFLFIFLIYLSSLSSPYEEPITSYTFDKNGTQISNNNPEDSGLFGLDLITWILVIFVGIVIWRVIWRRIYI